MIWLAVLLLAGFALAPLAFVLRGRAEARGRRYADLALHRAQLAELDRDLAEGRIAPAEHATATLEVQRRLLAAADSADPAVTRASRAPVLAALVLVPLVWGLLRRGQGLPMFGAPTVAELEGERRREPQGRPSAR